MFFLIYFLLFTLTYTQKCSIEIPVKYEQFYLCREKLNLTSIRIWLYLKFNKTNQFELNFFSYYSFTLRVIDLIDEHQIHLKDRFEKPISIYTAINSSQNENNTINIHNLLPGRYEICVNFISKNNQNFYYRSTNSCLRIPWNVPEHEEEHRNRFLHVLFMFLIIILLVTIAFLIYSIHQCVTSGRPQRSPSLVPVPTENLDEDTDHAAHIRFLVNEHFSPNVNPFELLVRRRIHQRYAHSSLN